MPSATISFLISEPPFVSSRLCGAVEIIADEPLELVSATL
jgi:hypothetical protein